MTNEIIKTNKQDVDVSNIEQVIVGGNLASLSIEDRLIYYKNLCESLKLNPLTKPFEYITLNGKLTLYAKKDATDQLSKIHGISIKKESLEVIDDICVVSVVAKTAEGRETFATGAVNIAGLRGDMKANAYMKCETKAKRRAVLSIVGLGFLDETEAETIGGAIFGEPKDVTNPPRTDDLKPIYRIDKKVISGDELNELIREKLNSLAVLYDVESYENWKKSNYDEIKRYCMDNREQCLEHAKLHKERIKAIKENSYDIGGVIMSSKELHTALEGKIADIITKKDLENFDIWVSANKVEIDRYRSKHLPLWEIYERELKKIRG